MTEFRFSNPAFEEIPYADIVPVYQTAFAGDPWNERSRCVDPRTPQRCVASLSAVSLGETCELCQLVPTEPAYDPAELTRRFEDIAGSRKSAWYFEREQNDLFLAGLAWKADAALVAAEKYLDVPGMTDWLTDTMKAGSSVWLDEVFSDRQKRPSGNLKNFRQMCLGFAALVGDRQMSFRTISPQMVAAAKRDFGERAQVFKRYEQVPDRRDFVTIDLSEGA